jgi:hypothetical protein
MTSKKAKVDFQRVWDPRAVLRGNEVIIEAVANLETEERVPLLALGFDEAIVILDDLREALLSRYDPVVTT